MARKAGVISDNTRHDLIKAAGDVFSDVGFEAANLRAICHQAGVTTGALYFFFANKDELFEEVLSIVTTPILDFLKTQYTGDKVVFDRDIHDWEKSDFEAVKTVLHLYYQNEEISGILFKNRSHPAVESFFDTVADLSTQHYIKLVEAVEKMNPEHPPIDRFAIHWFSHLEIDAVIAIISHGFNEQEAVEHAWPVAKSLRAGFMSLIS